LNGQALPAVAQTLPQLYCQLAGSGLGDAALRRIRDAGLLAVSRAGHLLRGSGKPFSCHLVGVASLVAESAPGEETLIRAALLHALYQERVSGTDPAHADRQVMRDACGEDVESLLHAYQAAGMPEPGMPLPEPSGLARCVRLLQLADQLEDALDGGPWWHGSPDDAGSERGCAQDRADRFIALSGLFEQAPALGAARMLERYRLIRTHWERAVWPDCLRSGQYSSFRPA
jgi:hypothetical protein